MNHPADTATLHTLHELHQRERDAAAARLAQAENAAAHHRRQLEQLRSYRAEYDARSPALHEGLVAAQQLDQAIAHQRGVLDAHERRVAELREERLHAERRLAAVGKLIDRRHVAHHRIEQRRDQQRTDEAAQRALASRGAMLFH
jgi:flagellar protein FliJ